MGRKKKKIVRCRICNCVLRWRRLDKLKKMKKAAKTPQQIAEYNRQKRTCGKKVRICHICHYPYHPTSGQQRQCGKWMCHLYRHRYKRRVYMRKFRKNKKIPAFPVLELLTKQVNKQRGDEQNASGQAQ